MTNASLYKSASDVQQRIALCVDEDGVFDTDKFDLIDCTFNDKAIATVAVYKGKGHTIDTLESYLVEIQAQIKREKASQERMKDYLQGCMSIAGIDKITSDDGLLTATLQRERDESVEIDEGASFPPELCNKPKPPEPSKTLIKAAILAGKAIAGARIVRKDRLQIK
jgi:hypothetical protein